MTLFLAKTPMKGGLVELPSGTAEHGNYRAVLRAADHRKPLVTAVSGFASPVVRRIEEDERKAPIPDDFLDFLEGIPASYVLVHQSWLNPAMRSTHRAFLDRALASGRLVFVKRFDGDARNDLFAVAKNEPSARPLEPLPWSSPAGLTPSGRPWREDAALTGNVDAPAEGATVTGTLRVSGWARVPGEDLEVTLLVDGEPRPLASGRRALRPDVCAAVPAMGDCSLAGFEGTIAFRPGDAGSHCAARRPLPIEGRPRAPLPAAEIRVARRPVTRARAAAACLAFLVWAVAAVPRQAANATAHLAFGWQHVRKPLAEIRREQYGPAFQDAIERIAAEIPPPRRVPPRRERGPRLSPAPIRSALVPREPRSLGPEAALRAEDLRALTEETPRVWVVGCAGGVPTLLGPGAPPEAAAREHRLAARCRARRRRPSGGFGVGAFHSRPVSAGKAGAAPPRVGVSPLGARSRASPSTRSAMGQGSSSGAGTILPVLLVPGAAAFWVRRRAPRAAPAVRPSVRAPVRGAARAACVAALVAGTVVSAAVLADAVAGVQCGFDARMTWNAQAGFVRAARTVDAPVLLDGGTYLHNPKYPLPSPSWSPSRRRSTPTTTSG